MVVLSSKKVTLHDTAQLRPNDGRGKGTVPLGDRGVALWQHE
jgi:hypothetical protein